MSNPTHALSPLEKKSSISACIISFNEERNIGECIDSVAWCDEVVVVDSFSEDRMDCDERVTPQLMEAIIDIMSSTQDVHGYFISRKIFYLDRWLEHGGWFPEWRLQLFRRNAGCWVGIDPHGRVQVEGRTGRILPGGRGVKAAVILHYSFNSLSHQMKVLDRYTEIQAGELFRSGGRANPVDLVIRPLWRFFRTYILRGGFLDGGAGFHMAANHAYAAYMKYAKLWEIQKNLVRLRPKGEVIPPPDETQEAGTP